MQQLLSIFGYLSVVMRGASLALQTLLIGSTSFLFLAVRPSLRSHAEELWISENRIRSVTFWAATAMAVVQIFYLGANTSILMSTADLRFAQVIGAQFFVAGVVTFTSCIALVGVVRWAKSLWKSIPLVLLVLLSSVATGHAWSRIDHRLLLSVLDLVHQLAVGVWIGGLPNLVIVLIATQGSDASLLLSRQFSKLAVISVSLVFIAGIGLSVFYIDSPRAAYGTAYGIMLLSKLALFGVLLAIGALNKSIVARLSTGAAHLFRILGRNIEAEIGIGFTVVLAAASLTSQPPAIDLPHDRLSLNEIWARYEPKGPRFISPDVRQLKTPDRQLLKQQAERTGRQMTYVPGSPPLEPDTPAGKAWSEYNHNWAGLVVLAVGIFAAASRSRRLSWSRHWPLLFIGLAIFILLRADPENWPLGPNSFWESFLEAEVLQHRFFALLIILFAVFEWRIQTGRSHRRAYAFVFPLACALGGALLFTHSHSLGNVKDETLAEWSHIPIAFFAVLAGWSRWTELRAESEHRIAAWTWPICFVMIGSILLLYRES